MAQAVIVQLCRKVGHGGVHVHGAHGVADHLVLLAHRLVGLAIFVIARVEEVVLGRVVAPRDRFFIEIVRLAAALIDEIGGQIELLALPGKLVEPDQRDLDFLVAGVAALLLRSGPESAADMVKAALHHLEEFALPGGLVVGDRAFK